MKFYLLVEGKTEELGVPGFINRWLNRQFEQGIGVQASKFSGWSHLHDDAPKKAATILTDPKYTDVIAVISLLDLYGPTFYHDNLASRNEKHDWGRGYMQERVRHHFETHDILIDAATKYRHFFAVHETEAWLIAKPQLFRPEIRKFIEKLTKPEEVNFQATPSKVLDKIHLEKFGRHYKKTTNARNFFPAFEANDILPKCPYLEKMLHELRDMARAAGAIPKGDWAQP